MTDDIVDDTTNTPAETAEAARTEPAPQYGVGPFSIREVALAGVWLVAFVISFFPVSTLAGPEATFFGGANVWVSGLSWILTIGVPTAAVFLLILRRLSPQGIRRVGSLGIDQFASVAFSVSLVIWVTWIWETVALAAQFGVWARSWVIWVQAVLMLAGVALTVFAPFIPGLRDDFLGRRESVAHRNARPVRAVSPRPARERAVRERDADPANETAPVGYVASPHAAGDPASATGPQAFDQASFDRSPSGPARDTGAVDAGYAPAPARDADPDQTVTSATDIFAPLQSDPEPDDWAAADETVVAQPAAQAFWALVPVERDVVDDYGNPLFRIGPTAWALVIEDRGEVFIVRHEDGRIGYLHDVSGVTRG